jgi:HEAT repeat protein
MNSKAIPYLQGLLTFAFLSWFAWFILHPHEPAWQGKPLSRWLDEAFRAGPNGTSPVKAEAETAIRQLGTNALPLLLEMADTHYTVFRQVLQTANAQEFAFLHLPPQEGRDQVVPWAFEIIGPTAAPAVPELTRIVTDTDHANPDAWLRTLTAIHCLAAIGPPAEKAVPDLIDVFRLNRGPRNESKNLRFSAAYALGQIGPAASAAIPRLSAATNERVAQLAIFRIKGSSIAPLIEILRDTSDSTNWNDAAWLLGRMGTNAEPAIPYLVRALNQTNLTMQLTAVWSLSGIKLQPELCVPALIPLLKSTNASLRQGSIYTLRSFGTASKAALPAIVGCLHDSDSWVKQQAQGALREIDPAAAARLGVPAR